MTQISKDAKWLLQAIEETAETGNTGEEYWRATYTPEDAKVVELLKKYMLQGGMKTYFDAVGNLYGRIEGESSDVIMAGSHRDTVRRGGKYDGMLGILTAIKAVSALYSEYGKPQKTIEIVAMCEEESSRFTTADYIGSRNIAGDLKPWEFNIKDGAGITLGDAIRNAGYKGAPADKVRPEIKHFIELHIEQGGVLEHEKKQIGIVNSIVGQWGGKIDFRGHQNHAGTTPMSLRSDPVPVMCEYISEVFKWVKPYEQDTVVTIGRINVTPGSTNVIPEKASINFDIRSRLSQRGKEAIMVLQELKEKFEGKIGIDIDIAWEDEPVKLDDNGMKLLEKIAKEEGCAYMIMDSGAGHDSQNMAKVYNTNMIFVPSIDGVSHSEKEKSKEEDIAKGLDILKKYIYEIGYEL